MKGLRIHGNMGGLLDGWQRFFLTCVAAGGIYLPYIKLHSCSELSSRCVSHFKIKSLETRLNSWPSQLCKGCLSAGILTSLASTFLPPSAIPYRSPSIRSCVIRGHILIFKLAQEKHEEEALSVASNNFCNAFQHQTINSVLVLSAVLDYLHCHYPSTAHAMKK